MDTNITRKYKNAVIEYVVEDDLITTGKVIVDGECRVFKTYETEDNADGIAWNRRNADYVFADLRAETDKVFAEEFETIAR